MSILNDSDFVDYTNFDGPNLIQDEEDVTQPQGLYCRNSEYVEGQVRTRRGFAQAWNPAAIILSMYNWVQQATNRLVYLTSAGAVISRDLATGVNTTITTVLSTVVLSCAQQGYRLFMTFANANGYGVQLAKVWDGTLTAGVPNVETVFPRPPYYFEFTGGVNWATFTEPSAGFVTAGAHLYALAFTTWSGGETPPAPHDPAIPEHLASKSFTSAGNKIVRLSFSPATTWAPNLYSVQVMMTTVDNHDRWFLVPSFNGGGPAIIPRGTNTTITLDINIDDVALTGGGPTEVTNTLFNLLIGQPPNGYEVDPYHIIGYNNRMVYLWRQFGFDGVSLDATILVSDPYKPQWIILAYNQLTLPELRDATTMFALGATLYVLGQSWIFAFSDNGQIPVQWAPPRQVSGDVGSIFIKGVTTNPSKGRAWICDHAGLFAFIGSVLPEVPASYEQTPDWDRINFSAPQNALNVKEYPDYRLVVVKAPLDGATYATHLLVWDYTNGFTPGKIKYCGLWNLADYPGIGDIEIVQNYATKIKELWISRGDSAGDVRRQKSIQAGDATDANPKPLYNDQTLGIDWAYKMLPLARAADGVQQIVGFKIRERGEGQINVTANSFDEQRTTTLAPITAVENSLAPGQRFLRLMDEQSEVISLQLDNGAVAGAYAYWAAVRTYFLHWMTER